MKKLMLVLAVAVIGFVFVSITKAEDPNAPKAKDPNAPKVEDPNSQKAELKIIGKVIVVKDANGVVTAVKLENKKLGLYNVVLDEKGKEIGAKMEGKIIAAKAIESVQDEAKWLTVKAYRELPRRNGKDGNKGPSDKKGPADK
ncbi:MAG TPA: hypothetical protein PLP05_01645 [Sedimentisphaerales bacterium]|nr:hypothetical protein [Sedimentisphaerales bacterium]